MEHQRRAAVGGLGQHAAVVHAGARGVTGRAGRGVEHEEPRVDPGRRAAGRGQLRGGLPVEEVGAEGAGEPAVERLRVDPQHVDVPRSAVRGVPVPAGVDAARGLPCLRQAGLAGVGLGLVRVAADPDPVAQDPRRDVRGRGLPDLLDPGGEALALEPVGLGPGAGAVRDRPGRCVRVRRGGAGGDRDLVGPEQGGVAASTVDAGQRDARLEHRRTTGLGEVGGPEVQRPRGAGRRRRRRRRRRRVGVVRGGQRDRGDRRGRQADQRDRGSACSGRDG